MRRLIPAAFALTLILASCADPVSSVQSGPQPASAPTDIFPTQTEAAPHGTEIRFALIGAPGDINVWALFDYQGTDYSNHALMNEYWPRLYTLAPPDLVFTPRAANGFPSPIVQESGVFTSTVSLRSDLKWTDGSPFTAGDVAFTVNVALAFELGFDWKAYYSPEYLERAEAPGPTTVKFYFKRLPNVGIWQYGVLQGPILQRTYWEEKIIGASALLPDDELRASINEQRARVAMLQPAVDSLAIQMVALQQQGRQNRELATELKSSQSQLDDANKQLTKDMEEYGLKIEAARQVLYALDDMGEPTLGAWISAERQPGKWVNVVNPDFPFAKPNFDRAAYLSFVSDADAIAAFERGEVNVVLFPYGRVSSAQLPAAARANLNGSARFLIFNPLNALMADPPLRQAIACMVWSPTEGRITNPTFAAPLGGFVLPGNEFWRNPAAVTPCADLTDANLDLRLERAVQILKSAGYTWMVEPAKDVRGIGLLMPGGAAFPQVSLLALSLESDPLQAAEAALIEDELRWLGISLVVDYMDSRDIRYQVFSTKDYDLAILGWRLGLYPGYLCEWFGAQSQFAYNASSLQSECDALGATSDLEVARQHVFTIQSILIQDLPFIPIYAPITYDVVGSVRYPFEGLLGGVNGAYGAPSLAISLP